MIGKVSFGSGVRGLTRYLTTTREAGHVRYVTGDQHEIGETAYRNLAADTPKDAAREMALTSTLSTRCEKPFMHLSLSWHPSEKPEEPRMIEAMDRMLNGLGLEDRQAVYAVHREKAHVHIHAAVNRVGREGTAWDRWQCKEHITAECRVLEREMGFEPIEKYLRAEHERNHVREQTRSPREQRIFERSGVEPPERTRVEERDALRERVGTEARTALRGAEGWGQAHERLQMVGVALEAYTHPKTARTGLQLVEIATGERMAASALGSDYGRGALERRLGAFEAPRGVEADRRLSPAVEHTEGPRLVVPSRRLGDRAGAAGVEVRAARGLEVNPSGPSLWGEYHDVCTQRSSGRENALQQQREHDQLRREGLRAEHRARMERVDLSGFPPALARALRSECAFAYAAGRETLDSVIAREREMLQEQYRSQSWTAYVVARAELGEQRAVDQLWRWAGQDRESVGMGQALEQPEGGERTPPVVRGLEALRAAVDTRTGEVAYLWKHDGCEAFRDRGDLLTVPSGQQREAMRSGLQLASAKWEGAVRVHGGEAFKHAAVEEALGLSVHILNPELQAYQEQCRQAQAQERVREERERALALERKHERGLSHGIGF